MTMRYIYCEDTEDLPCFSHATQSQIAKQELISYRWITKAIARETDDLIEAKARVASSRSSSNFQDIRIQQQAPDQMDMLCDVLDREAQVIDDKIKTLQREKTIIKTAIEATEFPYRDILEARYLGTYHTLTECIEDLGYEYNYLCALHGKALTAYAKQREIPENDKSS